MGSRLANAALCGTGQRSDPGKLAGLCWRRWNSAARRRAAGADILLEAESGTGKELLARLIHEESPIAPATPSLPGQLRCPYRRACWKASYLAMHAAPLPGPWAAIRASSRSPPAARCCWTKLARCRCSCSRSCCAFCRSASSTVSAIQPAPSGWTLRVIASTNRSLRALVEEGCFREDLYYRLNVIPLTLPALRERGNDVLELAEYFAAKFAAPNAPPPMSPRLSRCTCGRTIGQAMSANCPIRSDARSPCATVRRSEAIRCRCRSLPLLWMKHDGSDPDCLCANWRRHCWKSHCTQPPVIVLHAAELLGVRPADAAQQNTRAWAAAAEAAVSSLSDTSFHPACWATPLT